MNCTQNVVTCWYQSSHVNLLCKSNSQTTLTQIGTNHVNYYLTDSDFSSLLLLTAAGFFLNRDFSNFSHCFLCIV